MNSNIFFTEKDGKFTIPIPEEGFTINDENSEFTDGFFVSWTYPLSLFLNAELIRILKDLRNPTLDNPKFEVSGFLTKYGEVFPSKMKISNVRFDAKINFEFGVASLDVMDKKLSEIDLGTIVTNIYDYIDAHLFEAYPITPVCFPRIRTPKDYQELIGPLYGGSNVFNETNPANNTVYRNEFVSTGQAIFNFIKPIVYFQHILKKGFESEGYKLKGDIVTDPQLINIGFDHNNIADVELKKEVKRIPYNFELLGYGTATESFDLIGGYIFSMRLDNDDSFVSMRVIDEETSTILYEAFKYGYDPEMGPFSIEYSFTLPIYAESQKIKVELTLTDIDNAPNAAGELFTAYLTPVGSEDNKLAFILPNELVLNKYVPDCTFLEMIKSIKIICNYSFTINNNVIYMNKIKSTLPEIVKDFTFSEQEDLEVSGNDLKGFILKYSAPEEYGFLDYLYDRTGFVKSELKLDSEGFEIREMNAYPLPLTTLLYRKAADEVIEEMQGLPMVAYSGTKSTNNPDDLSYFAIPQVYLNYYKTWIFGRLTASILKWNFSTTNPIAYHLLSSDCIYAYSGFHKIKSIIKKHHLNNIIELEITSENRY